MSQRGKCTGRRLLVARDWGDGESGPVVSFWGWSNILRGFPGGSVVKNLPANAGDVRDLGSIPELGRSPRGGLATHSSILAWRIPWTEEPGRLQSIGLQRVGQEWSDWPWTYMLLIVHRNGNPLQRSCLENPRDGGALWASVYEVAQSQTQLKRLSSSSSNKNCSFSHSTKSSK